MTYRDDVLRESEDFTTLSMPIALYCAYSDCQVLIRIGEAAKKYDGATYTHIKCPTTPMRHFAAHKHPNTGMRLS